MQASKYLKIVTCPASQNLLANMGKIQFSLEISKYSLALQPKALVNTSGRVLFSSPVMYPIFLGIFLGLVGWQTFLFYKNPEKKYENRL